MTDAEMGKAMEICKDKEIPCDDCPLVECGDCEGISRQYFYDRFKQLQSENAELKSSLTHANEECLKWHERAQNLLKDSGGSISGHEKKISDLQSENAALKERLERALEIAAHDSFDYAPEDAIEQAEKELAGAENESLKKNQKGGDNK